jgi:hypothetical protein
MLDKILNILNKEKTMDDVKVDQEVKQEEVVVKEKAKKENTKPEIRMFPDAK